jgi:hypothetical protein
MRSSDLEKFGFQRWLPFNINAAPVLSRELPISFGVYAIRRKGPIPEGSSDIIYIGSATNKLGLLQRIRQYLWPGLTQRTNQRIRALIGDSDGFELSCVTTREQEDALVLEARILHAFVSATGSLPVENRQLPTAGLAASALTGVHIVPDHDLDPFARRQMEEEVFNWLQQADQDASGLDDDTDEWELASIDEWDPTDEGTEIDDYDEDGAEIEKEDREEDD